ncbi:MAG: hypothetical protein AAF996_12215 [Pseudomonadota bacterium]
MKHHIMIALGLLMAAVFSFRLANAISVPGWGIAELYLAGGIVIASTLIYLGLKERRVAREALKDKQP